MKRLHLFFILLLVMIFVGDGKQHFAEVVAGAGALFIGGLLWGQACRSRPPLFKGLWLLVLLIIGLAMVFSDSPGYSLSLWLRFLEGYLIYSLMFWMSPRVSLAQFSWGVKLVSGIALISALVLLGLSARARGLSISNLLYAYGGHNYLANLLLFSFPIFVHDFISGRKHGLWFLAAAILGLSLTFARGALIFAAIYLLWLLWQKRKQPLLFKTFLFSGATLFLLVVTAVAATSHLFDVERLDTGRSWWQRQTIKRPLVKNERLEYWRQATQAISERPLFGSGPGTFYLLSRRLHALPVSYAWYAHSYPLQTLAELGVIGALPVLALLLLAVFQARKVAGGHPLFAGLVLTLGYSLIEFNLDFLVIWLLFWGTCGLLLGKSTTSTPRATNGLVFEKVVAATVLLLVITQGLSEAFQRKGDARTSFFLAPQLEKRALELIRQKQAKSKSLTAQEENIVRFFHRRHPDVLFALAQTKLAAPQTELALELYRQAISLDPRSFQFYREYINFLLATSNKAEIGRALNMLWRSANKQGDLKEPLVDFQRQELVGAYSREVFAELGGIGLPEEGLPKILYLLGLKFLVDQPQLTRNLWLMARSLSPEWDYYHLELAALEYYAFSNLPAAKLVLANCQKYYYPARSCAFASQNIRALPPPGFHEQGVRAIPRPSQ